MVLLNALGFLTRLPRMKEPTEPGPVHQWAMTRRHEFLVSVGANDGALNLLIDDITSQDSKRGDLTVTEGGE